MTERMTAPLEAATVRWAAPAADDGRVGRARAGGLTGRSGGGRCAPVLGPALQGDGSERDGPKAGVAPVLDERLRVGQTVEPSADLELGAAQDGPLDHRGRPG